MENIQQEKTTIENEQKKLTIGLCDDEKQIHTIMQQFLEIYTEKNRLGLTMVSFYSAYELLDYTGKLDFLFLDIDMPEMDGIAAAHRLNARGIPYKIIMLTCKTERFKEAFQIGAFRFVTKPILEQELFEVMDEVREHMAGLDEITVYREGIMYTIMQREINYILSDRDVTLLFTNDFEYSSEKSLAKWMEELDGRVFFQCHRSNIVNLGKIERITKKEAILISGEKVLVSRRNRGALQQALMEYDTRRR